MDSEILIRRFAAARLRARVITPSPRHIFEMAISDSRMPRFDIWPGGDGNRVEVEGTDAKLRQLILFVQEQRRAFQERLWKPSVDAGRIRVDWNVVRRVAEDSQWVIIERVAPARKRHFLCGIDERDGFISQLPRAVSTVREAHAALRAPSLRRDDEVVRQGEWFFVRPKPQELDQLLAALKAGAALVHGNSGVGWAVHGARGGKPHVADEVAVFLARDPGRPAPRRVYVRGKVRHPDHATMDFKSWRRVVRNAEVVEAGVARMDGIRWVD